MSLGDVYDMAQKRAVLMREQALTEVEKLRQQQLQKKKDEKEKFVIPPSTGTLVVGDPVKNDTFGDSVAPDGTEKLEDSLGETVVIPDKATRTAATKVGPKAALSLASISSPLRDAFHIARQKSTDAANQLIFPIDTFVAPKHSDDDVHSGSSSQSHSTSSEYSSYSGDHSSLGGSHSHDASVDGEDGSKASTSAGGKNTVDQSSHDDKTTNSNNIGSSNGTVGAETVAVATSTLTPTRFAEATNSVFTAAVGRYRRLKDSAVSPLPQVPKKSEVVVGGADRVSGLRNFQLKVMDDKNTSAALNPPTNRILPPSMPLSSKVRRNLLDFVHCAFQRSSPGPAIYIHYFFIMAISAPSFFCKCKTSDNSHTASTRPRKSRPLVGRRMDHGVEPRPKCCPHC